MDENKWTVHSVADFQAQFCTRQDVRDFILSMLGKQEPPEWYPKSLSEKFFDLIEPERCPLVAIAILRALIGETVVLNSYGIALDLKEEDIEQLAEVTDKRIDISPSVDRHEARRKCLRALAKRYFVRDRQFTAAKVIREPGKKDTKQAKQDRNQTSQARSRPSEPSE